MKFHLWGAIPIWNMILLVSVVFVAFVLPILPASLHHHLFRLAYTLIYISGIYSLERRTHSMFFLFLATIFSEWISGIFQLEFLSLVAKCVNILFFIVVVAALITQIAKARVVNLQVILGSMAGYLLLGIIYSFFVILLMLNDPGSYNYTLPPGLPHHAIGVDSSVPLYYSFVTLASLGYGDVVPIKPLSRSLATWITVSGQFYIAVIVALLVGKFSAQQHREHHRDA